MSSCQDFPGKFPIFHGQGSQIRGEQSPAFPAFPFPWKIQDRAGSNSRFFPALELPDSGNSREPLDPHFPPSSWNFSLGKGGKAFLKLPFFHGFAPCWKIREWIKSREFFWGKIFKSRLGWMENSTPRSSKPRNSKDCLELLYPARINNPWHSCVRNSSPPPLPNSLLPLFLHFFFMEFWGGGGGVSHSRPQILGF